MMDNKWKPITFIAARKSLYLDMATTVLVGVVSFWILFSFGHSLKDPLGYAPDSQFNNLSLFCPAIFFAGGHGMGMADIESIPGLTDFIFRVASTFDLSNIPSDIQVSPLSTPTELTHINLIYTVGMFWRLFGVSTYALILLGSFLGALSSCLVYLFFRVTLSRLASVLGALLFCTAPQILFYSLALREFGKVPFFLGFILLAISLVVKPLPTRRILFLSALMGALLGLGFGFRQDLLICIPPALVTLLFFIQPSTPRPYRIRILSTAAFFIVFIVATIPIWRGTTLEGGQTVGHTYIRGISTFIEDDLDFGEASYANYSGADHAVFVLVNTYARRMGIYDSMVNTHTAEYKRASGITDGPLLFDIFLQYNNDVYGRMAGQWMWEHIRIFPGDLLSRAWCSIVHFFEAPRIMHTRLGQIEVSYPRWLACILTHQGVLAEHLERFGLFYMLISLIVLSARHLILALYLTGMLAWFCGYPSLLFEQRHFFHLTFIPLWMMLLVFDRSLKFVLGLRGSKIKPFLTKCLRMDSLLLVPATKMLAYVILLLLVIVVPVAGARMWQERQVRTLAAKITDLPLETIPITTTLENGAVLIEPQETLPGLAHASDLPPGETAWEYVAVRFRNAGYDIPIEVHYEHSLNGLPQDLTLYAMPQKKDDSITYFFPIYETDIFSGEQLLKELLRLEPIVQKHIVEGLSMENQPVFQRGKFRGLVFPEKYMDMFEGFFLVENVSTLTLLPSFQIPTDTRYLRTYKTCATERWIYNLVLRAGIHCPGLQAASISRCKNMIALFPKDDAFQETLEYALRRADAPTDHIQTWSDLGKELPELRKNIGGYLLTAGRYYEQIGNLSAAVDAYAAAFILDTSTADTRKLLDNALHLSSNVSLHVETWVKIAKQLPDDSQKIAHYLLKIAQYYREQGNIPAAIHVYDEALKIFPLLPEAAENVNALLRTSDNPETLIVFWRNHFTQRPNVLFTAIEYGSVLEQAGHIQDAASVYLHITQKHPECTDALLALARCYRIMKQHDDAFTILKQMAESHIHITTLIASEFTLLGEELLELHNLDAAERCFVAASQLDDHYSLSFYHLGELRVKQKRFAEALEMFRKAAALDPDNTWFSSRQEALEKMTGNNDNAFSEHGGGSDPTSRDEDTR